MLLGGCSASQSTPSIGALGNADEPPPALEAFDQKVDGSSVTFRMVPIPGGKVTLEGGKTVEVAPFWMATTETTWDLFDVFVYELDKVEGASGNDKADAVTRPSRPYVAPDRGYGHNGYAAISLAYRSAVNYCAWLSAKTGRDYRLPTEAQWRHVCALSGITAETLDAHAWHDGNCNFTPHAVGSKKPDRLGLYDLWGNVREWVTIGKDQGAAYGGSFWDLPEDFGCDRRWLQDDEWQMTDPQVPKSPWWLSDAPFMGMRVVCIPGSAAPAPSDEPERPKEPEHDRPE